MPFAKFLLIKEQHAYGAQAKVDAEAKAQQLAQQQQTLQTLQSDSQPTQQANHTLEHQTQQTQQQHSLGVSTRSQQRTATVATIPDDRSTM
jgi:hypothetical protein